MESATPVCMLKEMRAVEFREPMRVGREVRRHPVENHSDAALMQIVHEEHEILRRAIARRWREVSGRLISPRRVERMLHDRQQLDMSEIHAIHVVRQLRRDLAIAQRAVAFLWHPHPRAEMDFINRNW